MGGSEYTQQELTNARLPDVRETLWISPPRALTAGTGKAVPIRSMGSTAGKIAADSPIWKSFHGKFAHLNGCACDGRFAFSFHKVSSVWKGPGLVLIPSPWTPRQIPSPAAAALRAGREAQRVPLLPASCCCPWRVQDWALLFLKCFQQPTQSWITWPSILSPLPGNFLTFSTYSQ